MSVADEIVDTARRDLDQATLAQARIVAQANLQLDALEGQAKKPLATGAVLGLYNHGHHGSDTFGPMDLKLSASLPNGVYDVVVMLYPTKQPRTS